jgi:hypothetical protein
MMNGRRKWTDPSSDKPANKCRRIGGGASGAKGAGQRETAAAKHEPGTGPGSRAKCAGADTASGRER